MFEFLNICPTTNTHASRKRKSPLLHIETRVSEEPVAYSFHCAIQRVEMKQ